MEYLCLQKAFPAFWSLAATVHCTWPIHFGGWFNSSIWKAKWPIRTSIIGILIHICLFLLCLGLMVGCRGVWRWVDLDRFPIWVYQSLSTPHTLFPVELTPGAGRCKTHAPAIGRYKQSGARPRRVTGPIGASERVAKSTGQYVQSNASRFLPCRSFEVAIVVVHHLQPPVRPLPPQKKDDSWMILEDNLIAND